jgi:ribonuclease T2
MLHRRVRRVRRAAQATALAASFIFIFAVVALAQDAKSNRPGRFDFYVLSLSWSPTYCADIAQRHSGRRPSRQCSGRPYAFIVHGLWPQYVRGFPSYCQVPAPRIAHNLVDGMLDLMPSRGLIYHEWDRHGTCSGLSAPAFFAELRKARAAVKIPAVYRDPTRGRRRLHQGQSRPVGRRPGGGLQQDAADRSAFVSRQGSFVPRLPCRGPPRLPARQNRHAGSARQADRINKVRAGNLILRAR